jgi:hypothetical protein
VTGNKGLWRASGQAGFASLDARGEREAREVEAVAAAKAGAGGGVREGTGTLWRVRWRARGLSLFGGASSELVETL